jgi:hypothetical protein
MRTLLALAIIAGIILGYGDYHAATHGWLYINLMDTSRKPYGENIRDAEIRLLDGNGKLLANAKSDHQYGVVRLIHPDAGDLRSRGAQHIVVINSARSVAEVFRNFIDLVDRLGRSDSLRRREVRALRSQSSTGRFT